MLRCISNFTYDSFKYDKAHNLHNIHALIFPRVGTISCAPGFTEDRNSHRCFWFSDSTTNYDAAVSDCRSRTQNEGYVAEVRDSNIYNFLISHKQCMH